MTKTEWDGMELRDKNVLVAEKVMGWIRLEEPVDGCFCWAPGHFSNRKYEWRDASGNLNDPALCRFTTDRNACALVLDEIERRDLLPSFINNLMSILGLFYDDYLREALSTILIDTTPNITCYCAVKAVKDE